MSKIEVNEIAARAGNTITINSGDKISGAAGSIVAPGQVIQVLQHNTLTQVTMNSTSYASTGLVLAITPSSSSSKVLINFNTATYQTGTGTWSVFDIFRGTVSGTSLSGGASYGIAQNYSASGGQLVTVSGMVLDSPNTTSATTYTVGIKRAGTSANVSAQENSSLGTITLMEIAQ